MRKMLRNKKKGFTLLELLLTVVILAVLATLVVPRMIHQIEKAKEAEAVIHLGAIRSAELLLHNMTGRFVAADDEAEIQAALGLDVGGVFYRYSIAEADEEDFLALATPIGPLTDWLEEFGINKNGFVGYSPGGGGGQSGGSSGGGSGGSGGSGSSGGSSGSGSGSGTSGGGSVEQAPGEFERYVGPPVTDYTADATAIMDTLKLATDTLDGVDPSGTTGSVIEAFILAKNIKIAFIDLGSSTRGQYSHLDQTITINTRIQFSAYICAAVLAHEGMHAMWDYDYVTGDPQYGRPPAEWLVEKDQTTRSSYSLDNEYNAKITGFQVWYEFETKSGATDTLGWMSDESVYLNTDGSLKPEDEVIPSLQAIPVYSTLPRY
jgi:prepilin-type N-terminal cleavage/methylation domain-containing protein